MPAIIEYGSDNARWGQIPRVAIEFRIVVEQSISWTGAVVLPVHGENGTRHLPAFAVPMANVEGARGSIEHPINVLAIGMAQGKFLLLRPALPWLG